MMTGREIRARITANYLTINDKVAGGTFELYPIIKELILENKSLQEQCPHEFIEGICIFCDEKEGNGK